MEQNLKISLIFDKYMYVHVCTTLLCRSGENLLHVHVHVYTCVNEWQSVIGKISICESSEQRLLENINKHKYLHSLY